MPALLQHTIARRGDAGALQGVRGKTSRICQVLHSLTVGGAELLARSIAVGLEDRFEFVFACLDDLGDVGTDLRRRGFDVRVLGRRPGVDAGCARRLRAFLGEQDVDLVHAHQYTPFFYACLARAGLGRPPILFTEHGRHFPDRPGLKRRWFNRLALRRGDRVIGVGNAVRDALIHNESIPERRVRVIYNGIDTLRYRGGGGARSAAREKLHVGPEEIAVIQVARLDYLKDHATAIRTMQRVAAAAPRVRLFLVGEGPKRRSLEAEVAQRGLEDQVTFLGLRNDVHALLPGADIFLLTSKSEGIPLTVIEAMAAGLPVVATRVGGTAEVVREGETGLLAPSGDEARLAEALLRLADSPDVRARFGRRGAEVAERDFSETRMRSLYADLYGQMLAR